MEMPGRSVGQDYKYGMGGSEKDMETSSYTTFFRMYDPRLGRWASTDPLIIPTESPYAGMANNPIVFNDPLGDRVKFGSFKNFLKVASMWTRSKRFRQDWKTNVVDIYGMGGNDKRDLNLTTAKNTGETLSEAVSGKCIDSGPTTRGGQDYLRFNGNLETRNATYGVDYEAKISIQLGPNKQTKEKWHIYSPHNQNDFSKWKIEITTQFGVNGIMPGHSLTDSNNPSTDINFNISYRAKDHDMGNAVYDGRGNVVLSGTNSGDHQNAPAYDNQSITYHITAMGIRQVYRVERKLFSGWDHANKKRTSLPSNSRDVIKKGKLIKSQTGSTETIDLKE